MNNEGNVNFQQNSPFNIQHTYSYEFFNGWNTKKLVTYQGF